MNLSALYLMNDLGLNISSVSGDDKEEYFLCQHLLIILQH